MKAIRISKDGFKIVTTIMDCATIAALTGVGVLGWRLAEVHKRINKVELIDAKLTDELEQYFQYADEQKKKVESIKKIREEVEP